MTKSKQMKLRQLSLALLAGGLLLTSGTFAAKGGNNNGGGKTPKDSGESQSLNCSFVESEASLANDNPLLGAYGTGDDKSECRTGGTSQPNLSGLRLGTLEKGKVDVDRKLYVKVGECTSAPGHDCAALFEGDDPPDILDGALVEAGFTVRPYPDEELGFDQSHIQLLAPGVYEMAVRVILQETSDRWVVNLGSSIYEDPKFIGALCHNPDGVTDEDASVVVFPDEDGDGFPDGYVVTTGTFEGFNSDGTPDITPGPRTASICSNYSGTCGTGASASDLCDFVGTVQLQFTFDAMVVP